MTSSNNVNEDAMDVDAEIEQSNTQQSPNSSNTNQSSTVTDNNSSIPNSMITDTDDESNPKEKLSKRAKKKLLQQKLKDKVNENRRIITIGCGDWRCTNPYCKSNEDNANKDYTDENASRLALKMCVLKIKPCSTYTRRAITPLSYSYISSLLNNEDGNDSEQKNENDVCIELITVIQQAFTHFDYFNESFATGKAPSATNAEIDFNELDKTYSIIIGNELLKELMIGALIDTFNIMDNSSSLTLYELRAYLILIENPMIIGEEIEYYESLFMRILRIVHDFDGQSVHTLQVWMSNYKNTGRLEKLMHSLHQCLTLTIELNEAAIEDETNDAMIEFNYDTEEDAEQRDGIERKIEKRQQRTREECILNSISLIVSLTDIIFRANERIIQETADVSAESTISELLKRPTVDAKPVTIPKSEEEEKNPGRRLSLIGLSQHKTPLPLSIFQNDGLNEAICATDDQRQVIHRRDFFHWKEENFFTYLDHSYLLTAGSKSRYIEFENHIRQYHARRHGMMSLMFSGHMHINRERLMEQLDLVLNVRRNHIISDSLGILQLQNALDLRKRLRIIFDGEQGIDQGGLTKEYFQLMCKEIFDPKFGMFTYLETGDYYWFNIDTLLLYPSTEEQKLILDNFALIGKLMGIALYNNTILNLHFPKVIFKKLLSLDVDFLDFIDFNPEMGKAFKKLLKMNDDIENIYCWNFVFSRKNIFGEQITHDLKENGSDIALNNANKYEFVHLYIKYLLVDSVQLQFEAFKTGFKMVCDSKLFSKLKAEELELLICGSKKFDFEELEKSARYEDGLNKDSKLIIDFWEIAHQFCENDKRNLLKFCTGSDRVPIRGLGALRLKISKNGNDNAKLPTSHTCFNHLLLPEYSSKEILNQRLLLAIQNSEGFGLL